MGNKILLIVMLCAALGLFLYIRPLLFAPEPQPTLLDRLPESEVLGRFSLLDVARETNAMLYYQKVPFRDLLSADFMLSQAKNYGLDVQQAGYFFGNAEGEWGTFVHVIDSSRIPAGLLRLSQFLPLEDTVILDRKVHFFPKQNIYFFYDKSYLFVYHGKQFKNRLSRTIYAQHGEIGSSWKKFISIKTFQDDKLVVFSNSKKIQKYGIDYGIFAHDSDSLSFKLKSLVRSNQDLKVKLKEGGMGIEQNPTAEKLLNLHLDITEFRKDKKHPIYRWIAKMGRSIGFPTDAFFEAWEGDLSFQQGGTQLVEEEIIETIYDEEFNLVEKRKTQLVPVPGFSVLISVNEKSDVLVSSLFTKGIITKQGQRYRFLFSPPLTLNIVPGSLSAYSAKKPPTLSPISQCSGLWNYKGTPVTFQVDSLTKREVYGSMQFPVNRLLRKGKFF